MNKTDEEIYTGQTFGQKLGFGSSPAFLVIDFQVGFTDPDALGGYNINDAIANTAHVLRHARDFNIPIAHAQFIAQRGGHDIGTFGKKVPRLREVTIDNPLSQFVPAIAPLGDEFVVRKRHASAFFATPMASWMLNNRIDTVFIAGCTTSGCVRASVIDASAYGLRPMIINGCVGDRAQAPHDANMFDMQQKYADIVSIEEALAFFASLS